MGKHIHKSETYTDWCRRPLSENQITYALDDVRYLLPAYEKILDRLKEFRREGWVAGELKIWEDPATFALPDPQTRFLKIKSIKSLKPRNMAVLKELAAWRENIAVSRDCLAKFISKTIVRNTNDRIGRMPVPKILLRATDFKIEGEYQELNRI